MFALFSPKIV